MLKVLKNSLFLTVILLLSSVFILPQETTTDQENDPKKKEALKRYIDLLDSNDYVIVLINDKKVRIKSKPTVSEVSEMVWVFLRKSSGQYNYESIHKTLIDFEKTEEYNNKLSNDREVRQEKLLELRKQEELLNEKQKKSYGEITTDAKENIRRYSQDNLKKKANVKNSLEFSDIVSLEDLKDAVISVVEESANYGENVFSVTSKTGATLLTSTIKDILTIKYELEKQIVAYKGKVQEFYDLGTKEGDKYKYSSKVVEIQILVQDYEKKLLAIEHIISKLPSPTSSSDAEVGEPASTEESKPDVEKEE